jgi:hypothetical protein
MDPSLHDVIKAGYGDKKYKEKLKKFGYNIDNKLSSGNHQVYYNDKNKKLLFNATGTHNAADASDVKIFFKKSFENHGRVLLVRCNQM